jgi:hypothetical protein
MSKTEIVFNIINICITTIWLILSWKTLQEIKKDREEVYRPFLRIKLKRVSFNYSEKESKWIFLENIGYRFAKNIKIKLKISEEILKDYGRNENKIINFIEIPGENKYIRNELDYILDILDPKEKYFLKYIENNFKEIISICSLMIKKQFENLEKAENGVFELELKDIVLFNIDVSYQDVLNKNYNEKYKLKLMITEISSFSKEGFNLVNLPLKLEI